MPSSLCNGQLAELWLTAHTYISLPADEHTLRKVAVKGHKTALPHNLPWPNLRRMLLSAISSCGSRKLQQSDLAKLGCPAYAAEVPSEMAMLDLTRPASAWCVLRTSATSQAGSPSPRDYLSGRGGLTDTLTTHFAGPR